MKEIRRRFAVFLDPRNIGLCPSCLRLAFRGMALAWILHSLLPHPLLRNAAFALTALWCCHVARRTFLAASVTIAQGRGRTVSLALAFAASVARSVAPRAN